MKRTFTILGVIIALLTLLLLFVYERDITVEEAKAILADETSSFVEVDGLNVHYKREGQGFPIILIHGTGAILQTWDEWTKILIENDYEVIRMDVQSFGLTGPRADGNYSIQSYVDFLDHFIQKIGVDSFHIAGNSLGGNIAWQYAVDHQDKIGKMILIAPTGFQAKDRKGSLAFELAKNPLLGPILKNLGTSFFVRKSLKDLYFDDAKINTQLTQQYIAGTRRAGNRTAFIKRVNAEQAAQTASMSTIQTPTLLMWGDDDVLVPHTLAEKFQAALPNDTLILYKNMGHIPMEEIPQRTATDAMHYLER